MRTCSASEGIFASMPDTRFGSGLLFFAVQKEIISEINKKSEPISDLENWVRIILVWCG